MPHVTRYTPPSLCWLALALVCPIPLAGCGPTDSSAQADVHDHGHEHEHEHSHKPESLHAAVAELTSIREAVRSAIVDGDPHDAHEPLHEVGELLEAIPDVAAETDLPEEEWEAVKAANERLFEAFGAIDRAFHVKDGDKKAAYEKVANELEEAIDEIRSRLPLTGEDPDVDGDHHDHDDEGHGHDEHEGHDEDHHEHAEPEAQAEPGEESE